MQKNNWLILKGEGSTWHSGCLKKNLRHDQLAGTVNQLFMLLIHFFTCVLDVDGLDSNPQPYYSTFKIRCGRVGEILRRGGPCWSAAGEVRLLWWVILNLKWSRDLFGRNSLGRFWRYG